MKLRLTKYLALAAFGFVLASCTDEDIISPTPQYRDGDLVTLSFNISVPEAEEVTVTRAATNENNIDDLTLLVFSNNSDDGILEQVYTSYNEGEFANTGTMTDGADDKHKKFIATVKASTEKRAIYILANAGCLLFKRESNGFELKINTTTVANLQALQTNQTQPNFIMSGYKLSPIPHANLLTQDFPLYRTHAKVTVEVAKDVEDFKLKGFYLCNTQENGSVVAYSLYEEQPSTELPEAIQNPDEEIMEYEQWLDFDKNMYINKAQYPAPTGNNAYIEPNENHSKNTKLFLLIKGTYKGDTYYYHADFKTKEDGPLDVRPNHHYKVTITGVDRIGYVHSLEGFKGTIAGAENITTDIKDINPTSRHMASDGVTEIGVESDTLYIEETEKGTGVQFEVTVSPAINEENGGTIDISFDEAGNDWLVLEVGADTNEAEDKGGYSVSTITIKTTRDNPAGERREARMGVSCRGVLCYVTVIQEPDFCADKFGTVSLKVKEYERDDNWEITNTDGKDLGTYNDYWAFIRGTDTTDKLYGIQPEDMGGKIRTEGFHAPMSDYQQFVYTFTLPNGNDYEEGCTWRIELTDEYKDKLLFWEGKDSPDHAGKKIDEFTFGENTKINGQTFTFTNDLLDLQESGNITEDAYRYGDKAFRIVVTHPKQGDQEAWTETYAYDLYHTGVFNYDDGTSHYRVDGKTTDAGWYYYEVILMGHNYWLDRNLGAKSSAYYSNELSVNSEWPYSSDAAGGLYRIANAPNGGTEVNLISSEELEKIAPRGFRVPTMSEFQALTMDSRFRQEFVYGTGGGYWSACYDTGKPEQGTVYFPKNGMWYGGQAAGTAGTGYYWTQTAALGTSGTERGYWLQDMQLAGSNASAGRYRIFDNGDNGKPTGMSVRCVYNSRVVEEVHTIEFYVKGYTHVFLYNENEDGSRTYLNSWPGEMISINDDTALNMYHTFTYESMTEYKDVKVVFNIVDNNLEVKDTYPTNYDTNGGIPLEENKPFFSINNKEWSDQAQ